MFTTDLQQWQNKHQESYFLLRIGELPYPLLEGKQQQNIWRAGSTGKKGEGSGERKVGRKEEI